jgi:glycerophosphoryl diester phosphodiesterase
MTHSYFATARPHLLAHRGLSQHDSAVDENSIAAFRFAIEHGCTHIESDVHATSDGVAVLFHDDDLNRVAGINRKISEISFEELTTLQLKNGSTIPSLGDVLTEFPDLRLNLDIKSWAGVKPTALEIERHQAHDRVLVSSFSSGRRKAAHALLSRPVAASAGMTEVILLWLSHKLFGIGFGAIARSIDALQIPVSQGPIRLGTSKFISRARKAGLEVHFWTINDPEMANHLVELGATGIVTDRVDLIRF